MGTLTSKWSLDFATLKALGRSDDSSKARKVITAAYEKSGGKPAPELQRIYGEYLKYKKDRSAAGKN